MIKQIKDFGIKSIHDTGGIIWKVAQWPFQKMFFIFEHVAQFILVSAKTTVEKIIVLSLVSFSIGILASLLYGVFLQLYIPTVEISRPVYFNFKVCDTGKCDGGGLCSYPSANVSFKTNDRTRHEFLGAGQHYRVDLDLDLPDTPTNRDMGMFQVMINMFDSEGNVSAQSKRPAMIKYRSVVIRMLDMFIFLPFYFTGVMEQKHLLTVELFDNFADDYYHPSVGAYIELHHHHIQFYSAKLKFLARFNGLKYMLYYWPITSALLGILCNSFVITVLFVAALYRKAETLRVISETLQISEFDGEQERATSEGEEEVQVIEDDGKLDDGYDGDDVLDDSSDEKQFLDCADKTDYADCAAASNKMPQIQEPQQEFHPEGIYDGGISHDGGDVEDVHNSSHDGHEDFTAELRHRRIN